MRYSVRHNLQILPPEQDQTKPQQRQRQKDAEQAGSSAQNTLPGAQRRRLGPSWRGEEGSGPEGPALPADLAPLISHSSSERQHIATHHAAWVHYDISSDRHQI